LIITTPGVAFWPSSDLPIFSMVDVDRIRIFGPTETRQNRLTQTDINPATHNKDEDNG
jgi:hypothetical protein